MSYVENEGSRERVSSCDFCEIATGEGEAIRVADSEHAMAFLSRGDGHILVSPKKHVKSLNEGFSIDLERTFDLTRSIYRHVKEEYQARGVLGLRLMINDGSIQHVPHLHIHLKPYVGDLDEAVPYFLREEERADFAETIKTRMDPC